MRTYSSRLVNGLVLLVLGLAGFVPCQAIELLISDSGRNTSWTQQLKVGDSFDAAGADNKLVGGVFNLSSPLGQFLLPMPEDNELSGMGKDQEQNYVREWGELIRDRVDIAVMNHEPNFEIRLLENTPGPRNPGEPWAENPNADRFARIAYASIAKTVDYLKQRDIPVKITAALADTGAGTFARAVDAWHPYASSFRRADLVQGRAGLKEARDTIDALGAARVRIFMGTSATLAPPMTIGRLEVNESLLQESHGLTVYQIAPLAKGATGTSRVRSAEWFNLLSGTMPIAVSQLIEDAPSDDNIGGVIASTTGPGKRGGRGGGITRPPGWPRPPGPQGGPPPGPQPKLGGKPPPGGPPTPGGSADRSSPAFTPDDFRNPLTGWDPENNQPYDTLSLASLGVVAPQGINSASCEKPSAPGAMISQENIGNMGQTRQASFGSVQSPSITANTIPISVLRDVVNIGYAVYNPSMQNVQGGWQRDQIRSPPINSYDGAQISVYERPGANGKLDAYAAIAGTRLGQPGEIEKDFYQGFAGNQPEISEMATAIGLKPAGESQASVSTALALKPAEDLQAVVSGLIHDPGINFKGVIGQSEGGVPASMVGARDNVPSFTINGAALNQILQGATPQLLQSLNRNNINIVSIQDPVHPLTGLVPGASHFGDTIIVMPNMNQLSANPVYTHLGQVQDVLNGKDPIVFRLQTSGNGNIPAVGTQNSSDRISQTLNCGSMGGSFSSLANITTSWAAMTGTKFINNPAMNLQMSGSLKEQLQSSSDLSQWTLKMGPVSGNGLNVCSEPPQPPRSTWQPPLSATPPGQQSLRNTWQAPLSFTPPSQQFLNQDLKFSSMPNTPSVFQPDVRGVLLQAAAHVEGEPVRASELGLVFQDAGGVMDLDKLRRLETAMWAAYLSVDGPGISIDPVDPHGIAIDLLHSHVNTQHVRHLGVVRNTDLGRVMRETDYLMKRWAIGTLRPDIPGFLNPDEISDKTGNRVLGRPSRFWLLPQGIAFKRAGGMLVLSAGRMTVQTEYLEDNPKGEKNPENEAFADWFTDHYDQIAAKYPIYQELFEYAQLVGLCTYLKEQKTPLLWFLLKNREMILTEHAIDDVPALAKRSSKWYVNISGGVELEATKTVRDQSNITEDTSLAKSLGQARAETENQSGSGEQVSFTEKNTSYTVSQAGALSLSGTRASGDTVQTDFSHFEEYGETEGTNSWKLVTPGLEIIRYYSPEVSSAGQFGPGWYVAVPFHLTAGENEPFQPGLPPLRLEVHNVLSGEMEALKLTRITSNGVERLDYVPTQKNGFIVRVTPFGNGNWLVQDCLGVNLWFDADGDLTKMDLRPDIRVPVKLGERVLRKTIPGYSVVYGYTLGSNGRKRLESVEQGDSKAAMQWDDSAGAPRIGAIQVKRAGGTAELIQYQYGSDGYLAGVQTRGGTMRIQYQDHGMRVVASNQ